MATQNYQTIKNASLVVPTTTTDLGTASQPYGNLYLQGNITLNNATTITSTSAVNPKISSVAYPGSATAASPAGGETITINGSGFVSGAATYVANTIVSVTNFVNSNQLTFAAPAQTAGSYSLSVVNTDGGTAGYIPGLTYSALPVWSTSAGSLGSTVSGATISTINLSASENAQSITYAVTSGSLPTGLSLSSSGSITGTPNGSAATYNFTVTATDPQGQTATRNFSYTTTGTPVSQVEYLVVAGGGGAGSWGGGGGGAGGYRTASGFSVTSGVALTVIVGAGGTGGSAGGNSDYTNGNDSTFSSITSIGGGRGGNFMGSAASNAGQSGGSGGGGAFNLGVGSGTAGQGNAGGAGVSSYSYGGGGGGGAGAVGGNASANSNGGKGNGGDGGVGLSSSISGTATYYAGGGGGAGNWPALAGAGGNGGGGAGGYYADTSTPVPAGAAISGTANTGGGGGGAWARTGGGTSTSAGGAGGSGVVIVRYPNTYINAASTTGSPTFTNTGGYKIYKFTASGSITF